MSNFDDEDLEIEAIAKCAKALSRLDNESKTRAEFNLQMQQNSD